MRIARAAAASRCAQESRSVTVRLNTGLPGRVVAQIGDEIAVPLELERAPPARPSASAGSTYAVITRFDSGLRSSR